MNLRVAFVTVMVAAGCAASSASSNDGKSAAATTADETACSGPRQCAFAQSRCCGGLDTAVNAQRVQAFEQAHCTDPSPCPPPPPGPARPGGEPPLFAWCVSNACAVVDPRTAPISACATDDDCMLHHVGCCPCGQGDPVAIAKAREPDFLAEQCNGGESCGTCKDDFAGYRVTCDVATKHCRMIVLLPDGGDRPF